MIAWKRQLKIILSSSTYKKRIEITEPMHIVVTGYKYLSCLKDNFVVKIDNLTYREIVEITRRQYFDIEIQAGYESSEIHTIFKGGVLYISNELGDNRTNTVVILCTSKLVAKFGQSRLNLGLKSGINMYSALSFICKQAGIRNSNISEEFKQRIIQESMEVNQTIGSYLDIFSESNNLLINSDSSQNSDVTIWSPYRIDKRLINLTKDKIMLTGGYPRLTSDGLNINLLPTFNFLPGDTIVIDNSIIDISVSTKDEISENRGYYLDEDGRYVIYELSYSLDNRGNDFSINMLCKSKKLVSALSKTLYTKG